jgi:large subunit ribosomal protein L31
MKQGIHPDYHEAANVTCVCGNAWTTGSTAEAIHTDVCSKCHPFFTGEQRIVDTEGQVDRFYKKLQARQDYVEAKDAREAALTSPDMPISELELGKRVETILTKEGFNIVGQLLEAMAGGEEKLLAIDGFGRKSLADVKRSLKRRGFELPDAAAEPQVS